MSLLCMNAGSSQSVKVEAVFEPCFVSAGTDSTYRATVRPEQSKHYASHKVAISEFILEAF